MSAHPGRPILYTQNYVPPNHDVREGLPEFRTHGEWCRWLKSRGSLSEKHRRCLYGEECVASADPGRSVVQWRRRA